jgi:tRNA A-37 threonylcarbamoyl transferase component Bud32
MDYAALKSLSFQEIKLIAQEIGLESDKSKERIVEAVSQAFREYENYKKTKLDRWIRMGQLGKTGKDGTAYLVTNKKGEEYAMKTFRKQKSSDKIRKEAELQKRAAEMGVAPEVYDVDTVGKYIVMEKMDKHLINSLQEQKGLLTKTQQKQIIHLYKRLDEANVFHGDANPLNYMYLGRTLYIIDFGMAKAVTNELIKKLGTNTPNLSIMTLGMILKLKEMNCPEDSWSYLSNFLTQEQKIQFNI